MSTEQFIDWLKGEYQAIFKENYNEQLALESANKLIAANNDNIEEAKKAAEAIIGRLKAKTAAIEEAKAKKEETFDKFPAWALKVDGKEVSIDPEGYIIIDGKKTAHKVDPKGYFSEVIDKVKEVLKPKGDIKGVIKHFEAIKEQLFDAPSDVKKSFNEVVKYFSGTPKALTGNMHGEYMVEGQTTPEELERSKKYARGRMIEAEIYDDNHFSGYTKEEAEKKVKEY